MVFEYGLKQIVCYFHEAFSEYVESAELVESVMSSPSPYHLLDHEYGQTPQNQIMSRPPTQPPRSQVGTTSNKY